MNKYLIFKKEMEGNINNFPMFFAFSDDQFKEGLNKLEVKKNEIISIGAGGFIRKSDKKKYLKMLENHNQKEEGLLKDDDFLFQGFRYELANHEFCITYDYTDTLNCFGLDEESLTKKQINILERAKEDYLKNVE